MQHRADADGDEKKDEKETPIKKAKADEEVKDAAEAQAAPAAQAAQAKADEEAKLKSEKKDIGINEKTAKILDSSKKVKEIDGKNGTNASDINQFSKKDDRFLVLTHRRNLLSIMSSGLIGPKEVYGKYRDDILVHTKGLVPLFSRSISRQLVDLTTSKKDSNFPVVLELDREQIPDSFLFGVTIEGEVLNNVNKI